MKDDLQCGRDGSVAPTNVAPIRITAGTGFVFPGGRAGRPISNMAMTMTLRRIGRGELTVHGFRSTFRDWAAERTGFPAEVR
jgi:integrase